MEGYLGQICLLPYSHVPRYWMRCDGHVLTIKNNEALFSILGTKFGGDGVQNFALPKLDNIGDLQYMICTTGIYPDWDY
jgi:microcystin-dependent protein